MNMSGVESVNTPGFYYAIAYGLSCILIILNSRRRFNAVKTILMQIIFFLLLSGIMIVSDGIEALFVPLMLLYMFLIFLNIYLNCTYDRKTALYYAIRAFIIGEFTASLEWQIFYYAVAEGLVPLNWSINTIFLLVIHGISFALLFFLEHKIRKVNEQISISIRELLSVCIIGFAIFSVSNLSYVTGGVLFSSQFAMEIFTIRTLVDLGGVAILYAYHMQMGELNMRLEVERLSNMLNMQYSNYEILEKSMESVNQKYHDLKYQIAVLKQEAGAKESMEYLNQMEKEIKAYEAQNNTGNKVLDTILTAKSIYCQNNWIELTSVVDGNVIDFMSDMDISILFGNMLDNAIESVNKLEQKERRLIHLAVAKQKGFVRIRLENCYQEELVFENGLPKTTKKDKKYHGFGLKSIQQIVKKYEGSVTIHAEKGWFELRILIPV